MEILKTPPFWAAHTYLAHLYEHSPPPPPPPLGILTQWVMIPARSFTKVHESHLSGTISYIFKGINVFPRENEDNAYMHLFFLFLVGEVAIKVYYGRCANGESPTLTECHFIESFIWQCGKWNIVHPLRVQRSTKTDFLSNRIKFIFHFFMILLPHWYRLGFWISCCGFRNPGTVQVNYSSSPNGLLVNSPWGRRPNRLLT